MLVTRVILSSVRLDDEPAVDQVVHHARPDDADLRPHIPPEPAQTKPNQGREATVGVIAGERDELSPGSIERVAQPPQRTGGEEAAVPGGLECDEERLTPAAAVDLRKNPCDGRETEGRCRCAGVPVADAAAFPTGCRVVMAIAAEPDMRRRVVQHPQAQMTSSGLAAEGSAAPLEISVQC